MLAWSGFFRPLLKVPDHVKVLVSLEKEIDLEGDDRWARDAPFTIQHWDRAGKEKFLGGGLKVDVRNLNQLDDEVKLPGPLLSMNYRCMTLH